MQTILKTHTAVLAACLFLLTTCPGSARIMRLWTDDELWKGADLVVIARAKTTSAPASSPASNPGDLLTVETTFTIDHVLKGSLRAATFRLSHQSYRNPAYRPPLVINGGPGVVNFGEKQATQYLLFLRAYPNRL